MALDFEDDILQDFMVEAGEILEQLQAQLVDLERNPQDQDLLNAIFRGFHTVKGGAGFLGLAPMVDTCHGAENLFDLLRNQQLSVSAELMDVVLTALDEVNAMFAMLQQGEEPTEINAHLVQLMEQIASGEAPVAEPTVADTPIAVEPEPIVVETPPAAVEPTAEPATEAVASAGGIDSLTDAEYQQMLDSIGGEAVSATPSDDISEDEFESLLDQLHGKGQFGAVAEAPAVTAEPPAAGSDDEISDDEFESLLDELHGKGQFNSSKESASSDELISDDEFESLLDDLHGVGNGPTNDQPPVAAVVATPAPAAPATQTTPVQAAAAVAEKVAAATAMPASAPAAPAKKAPAALPQGETTVRVDTARLDEIMNMVGELVLVRNRLLTLGIERDDEEMSKALASLDMVTGDLQGGVMKTRMQPIKKVFGRFPRVVRDLARSLNKEIVLQTEGEETDLDKNLVEALADPLVHLVRNAVDHGIEMPDVREAAGKDRQGTVLLSAAQEGDHILLRIRDDGGGMNAEKLKQIAISRGVLDADAAARMSDKEAYALIFAPGFSTKTEISDISGRGVGMDVVKTRIAQLNGSVDIDSSPGEGTVIDIKVPLTLAIMPTLMVRVSEQIFALPLSAVSEIFHMDLTKTNVVDGQLSITVRERAIPLFYLDKWLCQGVGREERLGDGHVVIIHIGHTQVGFVVDGLIGQEEVVIKPLGAMLQGVPGMAGSTITSNGGIALILDIPGLLKHYARRR